MSRKHILFGFLLLAITVVFQIAAQGEDLTPVSDYHSRFKLNFKIV